MTAYAHVALPLPLHSTYTYRIPETLADRVAPGSRVVVPVRQRELIGVVVGVDDETPKVTPRDVLGCPDAEPALPGPLLRTAQWIAGYYGAPIGLTLKAVLPAGMWGTSRVIVTRVAGGPTTGGVAGEVLDWLDQHGGSAAVSAVARGMRRPVWDALDRLDRCGAVALRIEPPDTEAELVTERLLLLAEEAPSLLEREQAFRRKARQRALYEAVEALGGRAPVRHVLEHLGFDAALVRALVKSGLARIEMIERVRDPFADTPASPPPPTLTAHQEAALAAIEAIRPGEGALLFGVTGSGKTLVYLEAVRRVLARGRGAIVLVPEIGLTPQAVSRLRGAFGDDVAVLHSGLSDGERADAWRLLRRGERRVAVGARSAIFAPVPDLGIIVVDEEHEASYKNGEAPRYHARDVAAVRARLEGAILLLGSATPALETMTRAADGKPTLLRLPDRVGMRPLPPVELVDLRTAPRVPGTGPVPWSAALDDAVASALTRREQALLLLNRRGWAAFLQCPDCGAVRQCPNCTVSLTVHHAPEALRCHYCAHEEPLVWSCPQCGHAVQETRGVGTQQLERLLAERFPDARVARMDLDATSTKWSHQRILGGVERGEVDVLVGTQMIAKGLDFPNVTVVGVVDADTGLYLPDFRAGERTFQLLAQVAGRAGRGPKGGRVLVQTRNPRHHALEAAAGHDTEGFLKRELELRRSPPYPPVVALVNLVVSGPDESNVGRRSAELADWCTTLVTRYALPIEILGPAPCPIARIKERWRWHVLLRGPSRALGLVVRYGARRLTRTGEIRIVIDRDPVTLL